MTAAERIARLALRVARIMRPSFALWLGGILGDLIGRMPLRDVRLAREHLARAFPERDAAWHARTARACFRHMGRMALWTLAAVERDARELRRNVVLEGADNLRAALAACKQGDGTMIMSGHFGNWELLARVAATLCPLTVIGRRLRWPWADRLVWEARARGGARLIYQDDDVRKSIRELRSGRMVGTLPDQDVPRLTGDWVPWFGHPAYTPIGPAMLTMLGGGHAIPAHCMLIHEGGMRFRWVQHWGPRVCFPRGADRDADARAIMAWTMAYQEQLVRRHPEQWVWWHRRWKTQPKT
ncbi:MAG: hypothetical protein AAB263_10095 [Planctomycetota bacterium]